jgi:hypothetical protein
MKKVRIILEHAKKNKITLRMIGRASRTSTGARMQLRVRGQSLKKPATKYIYIFVEYHRVCPLVRIWTPPPPLPQASVPPGSKGGRGTHALACV